MRTVFRLAIAASALLTSPGWGQEQPSGPDAAAPTTNSENASRTQNSSAAGDQPKTESTPGTGESASTGTPDATQSPASDAQQNPPSDTTQSTAPQTAQGPDVATIPVPQEQPPAVQGDDTTELEEVTVTAQKFNQSAKDVPISMSVLSDEFVAKRGIVDIVQAMQYVPNVKVSSAGFFAAPQARGFSFNNLNLAFESPLGIAFDGIPYQSTTYFNSGLFDIDRIEVLRGPQGTTFGKNTTAGLVQILTADPTPEWSGLISTQAGELGRKHAEIAFGGPIIDDVVDFRISALKDDMKGFVKNTTAPIAPGANPLLGGFTHSGYRAKLKFPNLFGSDLKLSYESVDLDSLGTGAELWHVTPSVAAVFRKYDPNAQLDKGHDINSEDFPDGRTGKTKTFVGEWNRPIGEWDVTVLGGRSVLTEALLFDVDFSPSPAITATLTDAFPTKTLEARAKATTFEGLFGLKDLFGFNLGKTDFLGGVFYQHGAIRGSALKFDINLDPYLELFSASQADSGGSSPGSGGPPLGITNVPGGPPGSHHIFNQNFDQTDRTIAVFEQTEWKFLPSWALQVGLRVANEKKTGLWNLFFDTGSPDPTLNSLGLMEFKDSRQLSETQYLPKVVLSYDLDQDMKLFAHWARGFKAGGFNAFAYRDVDDELLFKRETTTEWGVDFKSNYLGGVVRPNLSVYRMDAIDFQVLGRVKPPGVIGLGTTKVFNAPKAYAQGVEGDISYLPFNGATILGTLGYNQTKYVSFPNNECSAADSSTYCDASGKSFAFAPKWDCGLTPSYAFTALWGLELSPSVTAQYISRQHLSPDLVERKTEGGFVRYNATIGLSRPGQAWSFQIIGNNLTDKKTYIRYGELIPNTFLALPEQPRTVFGQLRWTF